MVPQLPAGVFDVLEAGTAADPHRRALVTRSANVSYAELDALADRAAGALASLGIGPGDRLAVSLGNDLPIVVAFHGAMRRGAVWVGVNPALAPPEKAHMLADCGAAAMLVDPAGAEAMAGVTGVRLVTTAEWQAAVEASDGRPDGPAPDPGAPAAIAYTSGTTGHPKGAVHCQAGLILPGAATVARRGWGPELRKGDSLPLTILNMLTLTTVLTAQAGGTAVIMDRPDVASIVEWIHRERVTVWNGPPAQLWTMVRDRSIRAGDLASLEEVWVGGADCPDSLRRDFEDRFGVPVVRTYGLTEAPALVALDDRAGPRPDRTSGRPLDHIEVGADGGEIVLSPRSSGPWAGLYRPALGYWGGDRLAGGDRTLHTGDLGVMEASGHLRVHGRRSTVIIRGGANVYPAEVERVLVEAPGVSACAVVGVPDERLGERVGAAVEAAAGGTVDIPSVLEFCRARLAGYKVPERMVVVERLPRNQMGKVPGPEVVRLLGAAAGAGSAD